MAFVFHIHFDNSNRLSKATHYFRYKDQKFKLKQNHQKIYADVLLAITKDAHGEYCEPVYKVAEEYLSCLAWENDSIVSCWPGGGPGVPDDHTLRKARCSSFDFPRTPFHGYSLGHNIQRIAHVETPIQSKALSLYREAVASNSRYLSCLFFWQIIELGQTASKWINRVVESNPDELRIDRDFVRRIVKNDERLGDILLDDIRHAIAHITRDRPGGTVDFQSISNLNRFNVAKEVLKSLARYFILNELKVVDRLYLSRKGGHEFPTYVPKDAIKNGTHRMVADTVDRRKLKIT